jgi:hypothetical protein
VILGAAALAGCGSATRSHTTDRAGGGQLPADYVPVPAGRTAAYRLPAVSPPVARRASVGALSCGRPAPPRYGIHLELYAHRLVVPVPAGIGISPPQRRRGAYVLGGACVYPILSLEPTGVIVVDRRASQAVRRVAHPDAPPTLGALFAVWGQPLSQTRLASFRGRVVAFVGGVRFDGPPQAIPLTRHAEIVLQVDGALPPHRVYLFPPGL